MASTLLSTCLAAGALAVALAAVGEDEFCALQVARQLQQQDSLAGVAPDSSTTLRGGTWCEINAVVPNGTLMTVIACQSGATIPGPQVTNCCPIDTWSALSSGGPPDVPTGWGTPMDTFMTETYPSDAPGGKYSEYKVDGQKKLMWDVQVSCAGGNVPEPEDLVCVNFSSTMTKAKRDANCMYFHNAGYNVLPDGGLISYADAFTTQYPNRTYMQGKYQPIMRTDSGSVYILQSHPTTNQTSGQPYFPTPTAQQVGDDGQSSCDWTAICCSGLPEGWTLECGLLKENATCGASCNGNTVFVDDLSGTWCLSDSGAEVQPGPEP